MRIAVCVKQIIDPEIPAGKFAIDPELKRQKLDGLNLVMSSFDQNALEVALKFKDAVQAGVSVFSVGEKSAATILKTALSMGADNAFLVSDPALFHAPALVIAHILASALKKNSSYDLILFGSVSGDISEGIVGPAVAELLALPFLSNVVTAELKDEKLHIRRLGENGIEIWETQTPVALSVISHISNTPRYPKLKDIMAAGKKLIPIWSASDIGFSPDAHQHKTEITELTVPQRETSCEMLADNDADMEKLAALLLAKLHERKVL